MFYENEYLVCMCVYVPHAYLVPQEAFSSLLELELQVIQSHHGVLGTELGSPGRTGSAVSPWAVSLWAWKAHFLKNEDGIPFRATQTSVGQFLQQKTHSHKEQANSSEWLHS